jgi:hypothetical protein
VSNVNTVSNATSTSKRTRPGIPRQNLSTPAPLTHTERSTCVVYWVGVPHILFPAPEPISNLTRPTVYLPEMIAQTNMDTQSVNRLREELIKFTSWLGKHATEYFVSEYEAPSQEYIEQARIN